jgi:hypothetical protein
MRIGLIIAGLVLAGLGVGVLLGKFEYTEKKDVLKVGNVFDAQINEQKTVPQWVGFAGLVVGGVLVLGGALRKR